MKLVKNIIEMLLAFAFSSMAIGVSANASPVVVDFEHLGSPLSFKKLSIKEKAILQKLSITEESNSSSWTPKPRIVGIAGVNGLFAINMDCDSSANGSEEYCSILNIVSLETGKSFNFPKDEPLQTMYHDQSGTFTETRYITNNKGELVSLVNVGTFEKTFKGKKTCKNLGAILIANGSSLKLSVQFINKSLGSECFTPQKNKDNLNSQAIDIYGPRINAFFTKLIEKAMAN